MTSLRTSSLLPVSRVNWLLFPHTFIPELGGNAREVKSFDKQFSALNAEIRRKGYTK
jgi:hypothetical protein